VLGSKVSLTCASVRGVLVAKLLWRAVPIRHLEDTSGLEHTVGCCIRLDRHGSCAVGGLNKLRCREAVTDFVEAMGDVTALQLLLAMLLQLLFYPKSWNYMKTIHCLRPRLRWRSNVKCKLHKQMSGTVKSTIADISREANIKGARNGNPTMTSWTAVRSR